MYKIISLKIYRRLIIKLSLFINLRDNNGNLNIGYYSAANKLFGLISLENVTISKYKNIINDIKQVLPSKKKRKQ